MIEHSPAVKNIIHQKAEQNRAHAFCSHLYFTHQITASTLAGTGDGALIEVLRTNRVDFGL